MNVNIVRDYKTLKSRGFAYICYKDQRSTNLAVDNFNGIKVAGRIIQVDHCKEFKPPKYKESVPPEILKIWEEGCAPKPINISKGMFFICCLHNFITHFQMKSSAMLSVKKKKEIRC
jgi:RNA recognition motif-containing protein